MRVNGTDVARAHSRDVSYIWTPYSKHDERSVLGDDAGCSLPLLQHIVGLLNFKSDIDLKYLLQVVSYSSHSVSFYPRNAMLAQVSYGNSVCVCVCASVTRVYQNG